MSLSTSKAPAARPLVQILSEILWDQAKQATRTSSFGGAPLGLFTSSTLSPASVKENYIIHKSLLRVGHSFVLLLRGLKSFRHLPSSTMEDILFRSIANALQHFNVPSDDAAQWLDHNSAYLSQSISQFPEASRPFATTIVQGLFPRLNLFCYASLLNVHNDERLSVFHKLHNRWSNTSFTDQLPQYQSIKEVLVRIISFNPLTETLQSAAQDVMHADIYHMALRLIKVIEPETESRRQFFTIAPNIVPAREQNLIDLFQSLLFEENLKASHSRFFNGLLKLSMRTGLFPRSLIHNDVVIVEGTSSIAGGSFGDIWRGRIADQPVALKVMRVTVKVPQKLLQHHRREAIMWSQFNHPNVLPFYGVYCWRPHEDTEGERMALLSPWMENGNAIEYLAINPKADRAGLVLDIAQGLEYLHNFNPPFIHGDLKGNNILITSDGHACLADFCLSETAVELIVEGESPLFSDTTGNELFTAPEILFGELDSDRDDPPAAGLTEGVPNLGKTLASDVYSFGCVCYEIFTGKPRFCEIMGPLVRMLAIWENKPYPQPPRMLSSVMWEWTNKCWATRPNKRPTIREFLNAMDSASVVAARVPEPPQADNCSHMWDNRVNPRVRSNTFQLPPLVPPNPPEEQRVSSPSSTSFDYYGESPLSLPKSFSGAIVPHPPPPPVTLIPLLGPEHQFRDDDIIIAVMGATGTGKSTYINDLMGSTVAPVSHSIDSCTKEIQVYGCEHLMDGSRRVFIIDTPGFVQAMVDAGTILHMIATRLELTYRKQVTLSGILCFFDIGANRVMSMGRGNMSVFKDLCGAEAFKNVIVLTTGWEDVVNAVGVTREWEFKDNFLGDFLSKGGRCHRYRRVDPGGTCRNAWDVVDMFDAAKRPLLIQVEMVKYKKKFTARSPFNFDYRPHYRSRPTLVPPNKPEDHSVSSPSPPPSPSPSSISLDYSESRVSIGSQTLAGSSLDYYASTISIGSRTYVESPLPSLKSPSGNISTLKSAKKVLRHWISRYMASETGQRSNPIPEIAPDPILREIDLFPIEDFMSQRPTSSSDDHQSVFCVPEVPPYPITHDVDLFPVERWRGGVPSMDGETDGSSAIDIEIGTVDDVPEGRM